MGRRVELRRRKASESIDVNVPKMQPRNGRNPQHCNGRMLRPYHPRRPSQRRSPPFPSPVPPRSLLLSGSLANGQRWCACSATLQSNEWRMTGIAASMSAVIATRMRRVYDSVDSDFGAVARGSTISMLRERAQKGANLAPAGWSRGSVRCRPQEQLFPPASRQPIW